MNDLESHASGFVAKVGGTWTEAALEQFGDYLKKIGIFTSEDELCAVVDNVRKILRPTAEGFEERLELDGGDGSFVPYYSIVMRKVGC